MSAFIPGHLALFLRNFDKKSQNLTIRCVRQKLFAIISEQTIKQQKYDNFLVYLGKFLEYINIFKRIFVSIFF